MATMPSDVSSHVRLTELVVIADSDDETVEIVGRREKHVIDVDMLDTVMDLTAETRCQECGEMNVYDVRVTQTLAWNYHPPDAVPFIDDTQLYDWFVLGVPIVLLQLIALMRGSVQARFVCSCNQSTK